MTPATSEVLPLLKHHDANALDPWLSAADRTALPALAAGLRRDREAVLAAVLSPWSKGQMEGQIHRLTLIKRSRYGRAGFARLRRRVLRVA